MEIREQLEDVLALQEVAVESETAGDGTESADQDPLVWGILLWCRFTD